MKKNYKIILNRRWNQTMKTHLPMKPREELGVRGFSSFRAQNFYTEALPFIMVSMCASRVSN